MEFESEIYNGIATILRNTYSGISVNGTLVLSPSEFPCASIEEIDNNTYAYDSGGETHAAISYEVNIYSNSLNGKKLEATNIFNTIDSYFTGLNFRRTSKKPVTMSNGTIYRIVVRYQAIIDKNGIINRRR